jgi:glycosyltransferase involved in cell wall biosynthesis
VRAERFPRTIAVIISTYNWPEALDQCLAGYARQSVRPDEILIADDGSTPPTRAVVDAWRVRLDMPVRHVWQEDDGFRKTIIMNKALAQTAGELVIFTDGDCVPHRRFVEDHRALAEPKCWVAGRRSWVSRRELPSFDAARATFWRRLRHGRVGDAFKGLRLPLTLSWRDQRLPGTNGCNLAFWRDDLLAVNGFDEEYSGWGIGEDWDLAARLFHLGRRRKRVYGRAIVFHLHHPVSERDHVPRSAARLRETISARRVRCPLGLDQHLPSAGAPAARPPQTPPAVWH